MEPTEILDRARVRELLDNPRCLRPEVSAEIERLGPAVIPYLIELLADASLTTTEDADGGGRIVWHAATILGRMKALEAVEPLIAAATKVGRAEIFAEYAFDALGDLGQPALEPLLALLEKYRHDRYVQNAARRAVSHLGLREDRIFRLLIEGLAIVPALAVRNLWHYGDPRAIGPLLRMFDSLDASSEDVWTILSVAETVEHLGGSLTHEQLVKARHAEVEGARRRAENARRAQMN